MSTFTARVTRQSGEHVAGWLVFHDVGEVDHGRPETYGHATFHPDQGEPAFIELPGYVVTCLNGVVAVSMFGLGERHEFEIHDCKENGEA